MSMTELSIVIVSFNTCEILRECLQAVFKYTTDITFEVIVVDNASQDGSPVMVREAFPLARLVELNENIGFGMGNNVGVKLAHGRNLFLLNSDAILRENTPLALSQYLQQHPDIACLGPRIVCPDGQLQPKAFGHLPSPWRLLMQSSGLAYLGLRICEGVDGIQRETPEMDVGWLSGVCLSLRREDYLAVEGFDPRFFMYAEDVALCGRLHREKGRVVLLDRFDVLHYGGAGSPNLDSRVRNAVWQQRHILQVCQDEYGRFARFISNFSVAIGLLLRLAVALALLPARGVRQNIGLYTNRARLLDIFGWCTVPSSPQAEPRGNQHAHWY
jgi:GT2 family glycosyltransferase